ncbi:MAG: 2OG-Fe(II) oxygenase family protein [Polyangiaceae bacterium]
MTWVMSTDCSSQLVDRVGRDLLEDGFATVTAPSLLLEQILGVFGEGRQFFARPEAHKSRLAWPTLLEGHRSLGIEYSQRPDRPDLNESFSVWPRNQRHPEIARASAEEGLHRQMNALTAPYVELVDAIFRALIREMHTHAPPISFLDASYLQVNYYRPETHNRDFLQDAHEDGHLLTVLKPSAPGLEVGSRGAFQPLDVGEDELLVFPGSILTLMTGGRIQPLQHRVRNHRRLTERLSLMFFVNPTLETEIEPWVVNEMNRGISIRERVNANSGLFGLPTISEVFSHETS